MKKYLSWAVLLFLSVGAFAQPGAGSSAAPSQVEGEGERTRMALDRQREQALHAQQRTACYARFAVNDCLTDARVRLRSVLDDLRRQEVALNDAERQRKALAQSERLQQRSSGPR